MRSKIKIFFEGLTDRNCNTFGEFAIPSEALTLDMVAQGQNLTSLLWMGDYTGNTVEGAGQESPIMMCNNISMNILQ